MCVRRCPTLPFRVENSTIGAERLSFRVRDGTGRFPLAVAAVTLSCVQYTQVIWWWSVVIQLLG